MQYVTVLSDHDTFSGIDNSSVKIYVDDDDMREADLEELQNGCLPTGGLVCEIDIVQLVRQAVLNDLPCVARIPAEVRAKIRRDLA